MTGSPTHLAALVELAMENDGRTSGDSPPSHRGRTV